MGTKDRDLIDWLSNPNTRVREVELGMPQFAPRSAVALDALRMRLARLGRTIRRAWG